ncbi:MAG: ABC transporter substrate-binding protein [Actinomycetota bacterium]|nr:ABC transporter substrate-binding protein [Actinomycetota bacterium]
MNKHMTALTVVSALLAGVVLSGTALAQTTSPTVAASGHKIVYRIGTPTDMISPNVFRATNTPDYEVLFNAYDLLFNFNPADLTPAPGLATQDCDPDSSFMKWTCHIRSGVMWSDGQPLTSADIAFTYHFILTTDYYEVFTSYLPYNPTFETPDATTLIWKSEKPTFAPTIPPWIPILPEHIWKQFDGNVHGARFFNPIPDDGTGMVGSGPFILKSWTHNQGWVMEANKSYWGGSPTIDELQYVVFDNQEAMGQALKAGEIDFADNLEPTLFNSLKDEPNIGLVNGAPPVFNNLAFNFGGQDKVDPQTSPSANPVIHDLKFRQAVAMGIDKQAIVDKVFEGDAQVGGVIVPPSHATWYFTPPDADTQDYDPAAANALLDEAGYAQKNSDGIRLDKEGNPIDLNILTLPEETGSVDTGKIIQSDLELIGVGVTLKPVSDKLAYDIWYEGDFDAYVWGWGGDPDPNFILSIFTTAQCLGWSDGCYSDPTYDKMFSEQQKLIDPSTGNGRGPDRITLVNKMEQYEYDQIPEIVLNYPNWLQAYRTDTFAGYIATPTDGGVYMFGWGPYSVINLKPLSATAGTVSSGGIPAWLWIVGGIAIVIIVALVLLTRRRRAEEEA